MKFNTRIAPSPTGYFHLGTARTAYFNWLAARATGGKFLLRIDDTDAKRNDPAFTKVIYDAMEWLGLGFDQSFSQSERSTRYLERSVDLSDRAYEHEGAIWLRAARPSRAIQDLTGIIIQGFTIPAQVLIKSNGSPTYHFASVVDDIDSGINLVIRGADHVANTMRQVAIYEALGAPVPQYAHVGLIHSLDGRKLSKSTGAKSLLDFKTDGIHPEAMLNFLLRLGWSPKGDDRTSALIPRARAVEMFLGGGNLRNQAAKADFVKLAWYNRKYQ